MQSSTYAFLAITTFVYISSTLTAVYSFKCSGKWAIHACYGGGKRSGPPSSSSSVPSSSSSLSSATSDSDLRDRQYILRQLLLSDRLSPSFPASNDLVLDSENKVPASEDNSIYPDEDEYSRLTDIEKAKSLLGEWILQRRFRDAMSGDFDYKR